MKYLLAMRRGYIFDISLNPFLQKSSSIIELLNMQMFHSGFMT
jgi:hypothetical protein